MERNGRRKVKGRGPDPTGTGREMKGETGKGKEGEKGKQGWERMTRKNDEQ